MIKIKAIINNALKKIPGTTAYKINDAMANFTDAERQDIETLSNLCKMNIIDKSSDGIKYHYYYAYKDMDLFVAEELFNRNNIPMEFGYSLKNYAHNYVLKMQKSDIKTIKNTAFIKSVKRAQNPKAHIEIAETREYNELLEQRAGKISNSSIGLFR